MGATDVAMFPCIGFRGDNVRLWLSRPPTTTATREGYTSARIVGQAWRVQVQQLKWLFASMWGPATIAKLGRTIRWEHNSQSQRPNPRIQRHFARCQCWRLAAQMVADAREPIWRHPNGSRVNYWPAHKRRPVGRQPKTAQHIPFAPVFPNDRQMYRHIYTGYSRFPLDRCSVSGYRAMNHLSVYHRLSVLEWYWIEYKSSGSSFNCLWRTLHSAAVICTSFSWVGLNAPHMLKLSFANFNCSMKYGMTDSRKLPIICRDINNPANCSFNFSWSRK